MTESEFSASGIVLNPRDWHNIALLKDNEGRYLFGGPQAFTSNIMWACQWFRLRRRPPVPLP